MFNSEDEEQFTILHRKLTYVVLLLNTNEKFLQMTFDVLNAYKVEKEKQKNRFGCSVYVFPLVNYIYKTISNMQPLKLQKSIQKVHTFNFQFMPVEEGVISLELNDITRDLFIKNDKKIHRLLAEYMYKINFIFGKINDYVYRGTLSKKVVELFVRLVWDSELTDERHDNNFHEIREWVSKEIDHDDEDSCDEAKIAKEYAKEGQAKMVIFILYISF